MSLPQEEVGHMSEKGNTQWLLERVEYLRKLKAPNEQQRLLMQLAEKPDRSSADDRNLAVLVRAEKADERLAKLRASAARVVSEEKAATRKARNHRLIQQGLLFDLVGLESRDPAELAGALAALAEVDDPSRWAQWKIKGQAILARKTETGENLQDR